MLSYSVLSTEFVDLWKDEFRLAEATLVEAGFALPVAAEVPPVFEIVVAGFDTVTEQLDCLASLFVEVICTLLFLASGGS